MVRELDRMTYEEVEEYVRNGPGLIVLPAGSTEEHGPHGPTGTDTFAATLVSHTVAEHLDAIVAPALPYGMSCDEIHFKGTVALRPSTVALLVREICENFIRDGFRLVLVLSGHRGNDHSYQAGLQEAAYESNTHVLYMSYQDANRGRLKEVVGDNIPINPDDQRYGADGHGGSTELSIAMAYSPGSVKLDKRLKPDRTRADVLRSLPFRSILSMEEWAPSNGFFGDPSYCSEELGHRIVERTAEYITAEVQRYLDTFPERFRRNA